MLQMDPFQKKNKKQNPTKSISELTSRCHCLTSIELFAEAQALASGFISALKFLCKGEGVSVTEAKILLSHFSPHLAKTA